MSLLFWLHSIYLALAVFITYSWTQNSQLSQYDLQLTAALVTLYFLSRYLLKKRALALEFETTIILVAVCLLLVFSTGGLDSPLFFLCYFLLFAMALLFEPWQASVLSLFLVTALVVSTGNNPNSQHLANLISLLLITPLAIVMGKKYLEVQAARGAIQILEQKITDEETDTLVWIATQAKPSITNILDLTSEVIGSNLLPRQLQQKLQQAHDNLKELHHSANILEKSVEDD